MLKLSLTTLIVVICQISFASSAMAAIDYLIDDQQRNFTSQNPNILDLFNPPEWGIVAPDSFIDEEKENRQANYLSIANLINQKKFEQARNKITSLLKQTPDDPNLYNLQAHLNIMEGNKGSAKQGFLKAIKLDPNNAPAYFGLAKLAIADEQLDKAKDYADKVLTINDKVSGVYLLSAGIAYKQGDKQKTEQILLTGYQKVQGNINSETQIIKALSKFYVKQPEKILTLSQDIAKRYPDSKQALSILAGAQIVNNQKSLAEQTLEKIIQQDKNDTKHRILLARLLSDQPNKENDVLRLLDEAFKINPTNPQALIFKTSYFVKLKKYQQALDTSNKIIKIFPTLAIGKQLKGDIYFVNKKLTKALDAYQQAYQIKPNIKLLLVMADLMTVQGKQNDAIKLLKRESGKHNNNIAINYKLATIYQQQGDYKQSEKYYKAMLTEQAENVIALNNLAWIYVQQNNPEAIKLAKQAYNKAPQSAAIADTYGYILIKEGKVNKGLKILQEAAKAAPQQGDIQFHLAEAYNLTGDKQQAITILEILKNEAKSFPEKEKALQLLTKLKTE